MKALGALGIIVALWFLLKGKGGSASVSPTASTQIPTPDQAASNSGVVSNAIDDLEQAIFQKEGGKPGDANVRYNNPGDVHGIGNGPNGGYATLAGGEKIATFADQGDGWDALTGWINKWVGNNPQGNLYDFSSKYVIGHDSGLTAEEQSRSDNNAEYIASYMGVDPAVPLAQTLGYSS